MRKIVFSIVLLLGLAVSALAQAVTDTVAYRVNEHDPIGRRLGWSLHQTLADVYSEGFFLCEDYRSIGKPNDFALGFVGPFRQERLYYELLNGRVVMATLNIAPQNYEMLVSAFTDWWPRVLSSSGPVWLSPFAKVTVDLKNHKELFVYFKALPARPTASARKK